MTTLPQMGLVLPTRGAPGSGIWDDTVDADLALIDAHNHSTGQGTAVPTAGININADLTFSSLYAPTNLHRITFASIVALTGNNKSLFVNTADNELYWRSNAGANVKLTSGSSLNVSAFTGGIGGDYAAVGAAVAFDDAGDRYTFKQNSPGFTWARLASGDVRLFETGTTDSVFVGLAAPAALAGSYTITMPLAVPAATRPVQMSSAGVLTAGDSDNVAVGGTLSAAGLVTATAGATAAANQHFTVSGTGEYKHGDRTLTINALDGNASAVWAVNTTTKAMESNGSGDLPVVLPLKVGDRIKSMRFMLIGNGTADITTTVTFLNASMVGSSIGTNTTNNQAAAWTAIPIDLTDTTIIADSSVVVVFAANAAGLMVGTITYTFDHP